MACIERKELSKNAMSAVRNVNAVRGLAATGDLTRLSSALHAAQTMEREALAQLVMHRKQHGC